MGAANLFLGIALIILAFFLIGFTLLRSILSAQDLKESMIGILILCIPMIGIGALFLRIHDRSKKKEKN